MAGEWSERNEQEYHAVLKLFQQHFRNSENHHSNLSGPCVSACRHFDKSAPPSRWRRRAPGLLRHHQSLRPVWLWRASQRSSASNLTSGTASNKFTDLSCSELSGDILDNHSGDIFGNLSGDILGDHSTSGYQSDSEEKEEEDTNLEFLRLPRISIMIRRGLVKKNRKIFSSTSICG